jgi:Na+-driven multidrug efflux pump
MIIGLLAIFAVDLADAFWVARLSTLELATLGFCFPAVQWHVIFSISLGLSTAATAVMAQQIGAGSTDGARNFARDSLIVSVVLMAIVAAVGLLTMDLVFTAIGATGTTLA